MSELNARRYIRWYDKISESAVGDEDVTGIDLKSLQKLFNISEDNPMYDSWEVKEEHVESLQRYIKHSIELDEFDYFVEASAIK